MIKLKDIAEALNLKVNCCSSKLDIVVKCGYSGDLLSDVIANSAAGSVWITRQVHMNIIAVALIKDIAGIIIVQGAEPDTDTINKAAEESIPVFTTQMSAFETAGTIFNLLQNKREENI